MVELATDESYIEKEAKSLTNSYGLEQSKALAIVRGLKREGLTIQDLNETLTYDTKEAMTIGVADEEGKVMNYDTVQPKMLKDIEELNTDNVEYQNLSTAEKEQLKLEVEAECKNIIDNNMKTGILVSKIEEGIEEAIGYIIDNKVGKEVKKAAGYEELMAQYEKGEITKDEIIAKVQAKYTEMMNDGEFAALETRFNQRRKMRKIEKDKRDKFSVANTYSKRELINNGTSYINYIEGFKDVRKGDVGWVEISDENTSDYINAAKRWIIPHAFNLGQIAYKPDLDHAFFVGRGFSELVEIVKWYEGKVVEIKQNKAILDKDKLVLLKKLNIQYIDRLLSEDEQGGIKIHKKDTLAPDQWEVYDPVALPFGYKVRINERASGHKKWIVGNTGFWDNGNGVSSEAIYDYVAIRVVDTSEEAKIYEWELLERKMNYYEEKLEQSVKNKYLSFMDYFEGTGDTPTYKKGFGYYEGFFWNTVKISKVQKKYLYTAVKWSYYKVGPKWCRVKIWYPEFFVTTEYSYPDNNQRNMAYMDVLSRISNHDTWALWDNCSTMIYDVWANIDSGHISLTGSGYEIDDWWNAWKIPDGSYRHENTRGIIGYTVNREE